MTKKIFGSIVSVAAIVLLCCLILVFGVLYDYFGNVQESQLRTELGLASAAVEQSGMDYLNAVNTDNCRLTLVSFDGRVLFDSQGKASEMENHLDREEIKEALENGTGESSRYSATLTEQTLYYATRLSNGDVLRISVSRLTIPSLVMGMLQVIAILLVVAIILSAVLANRMAKSIVKPLNAIDLNKPLENDTYDELSPLLSHIEQQKRQIRNQENALEDRKREFFAVIRNMNEGLVLLSEKETILSINPAAATFFGSELDCEGKAFVAIERSHEIGQAIKTAKTSGHSEIRMERGGREYQLSFSRIEENGQVFGLVILIVDITEKAFAEQRRKEFTANVSHELKTPLQSIMGSAELIENGLVKPEDMSRFVGKIRSESSRLVLLIEDIIRLSRLDEAGEMELENVDIYELAKNEINSLLPIAKAKNISISVNGSATEIKSVRQLLSEIVHNLCDNAVKYNVEGGSVTVNVSEAEKSVIISVADTGIGIPPEHQDRVFERFYRVDKSHSRETGGTGLGLSIVKHAVAYLNGKIELKSESGVGTTVTVILPR